MFKLFGKKSITVIAMGLLMISGSAVGEVEKPEGPWQESCYSRDMEDFAGTFGVKKPDKLCSEELTSKCNHGRIVLCDTFKKNKKGETKYKNRKVPGKKRYKKCKDKGGELENVEGKIKCSI